MLTGFLGRKLKKIRLVRLCSPNEDTESVFKLAGIPKGCNSLWSFFWEEREYEGDYERKVGHGRPIVAKSRIFQRKILEG